jgi:hypothetical protein
VSDNIAVWVPDSDEIPKESLLQCIHETETVVLPRLETLWGSAADIDGDGRIAVLVSDTINKEKSATGFFNPADFFKYDADINSENYNPTTNEMDIIYIAVPEDGTETLYSVKSIIATIAHELTHAITFTRKTWQRQINGELNAAREDLFLDEGFSHLSENLCGYGISGGNFKFLQKFFEDTAAYSFCGPNRYGQEDSAGMRGAITLFLSWLFWGKGGLDYGLHDPNKLIDMGGISFLQELVDSPETGWENIGKIYGIPTGRLFEAMVSHINTLRLTGNSFNYRTDAVTGEPVEFFSNMKFTNNNELIVYNPVEYPVTAKVSSGSWSFAMLSPFVSGKDNLLRLNAEVTGAAYFIRKSGG